MAGADSTTPVECFPPALRCENVPVWPVIVLRFDRIPAPSSIGRANYRITSGTSGDLRFKRIRVDPVERTVVISFESPLPGETTYTLALTPTEDRGSRLAAFDGAPFQGPSSITLITQMTPSVPPREPSIDPAAETTDPSCELIPKFRTSCSSGVVPCHGVPTNAPPPVSPALGLVMMSYDSIEGTAVRKASKQVQTAQGASGSGGASRDFPSGLTLIDPGNSAGSYLLYTILKDQRRAAGFPDGGVPTDDLPETMRGKDTAAAHVRAAKELSDLLPGAPMPYSTYPKPGGDEDKAGYEFAPWTLQEVRLLRAWIDQGLCRCNEPCPGRAGGAGGTDGGTPDAGDSGAVTDASDGSVRD